MANTILIARKIVLNNLGNQFRELTGCEMHNASKGNYTNLVRKYSNIITWGMKLGPRWYQQRRNKNFLFVENGIFNQKDGMYIDHKGWFSNSSICKENDREPTDEEVQNLENKVQEIWGKDLYQYEGNDGPVLFACQMARDMGPKHYYKHTFYDALKQFYEDYKDEEVVIRPHPRERLRRNKITMGKNWSIDSRDENVYDSLRHYRKVVSVNSTLLIEAAALGLPVYGYGGHVYNGYNLSDRDERTKFLCAVLRHHIPYNASTEFLANNESFQKWNDKRQG